MAKSRPELPASPKPAKKELESYIIKGTNKVVKVGDCVLMRPSDTGNLPFVARVEQIEVDRWNDVKVRVRWYYRPEESIGGRRPFHGAKELFLSDHYDVQNAHFIEGKCIVHSFKGYTKLENVGAEDYYCRFEYKAASGAFTPDRVAVYCKCQMPYNPDDLMIQCEGCKDWYHPACVGMTIEEARKSDQFVCAECSDEYAKRRSHNGSHASPVHDIKDIKTLAPMAKTRPVLSALPRPAKKELKSYIIKGTKKVVEVGDCVMIRPKNTGKRLSVARIEHIEADSQNNIKVRVRWYYRPEESIGGRRPFHGAKELFLSDHYSVRSAHRIEGKCIVHSFKGYTKLDNIGAEDYYCRFAYNAASGAFKPDNVTVYCKCEMPYNPDDLMIQCEGCKDWYHPACVGMTIEEAKKLDNIVCAECSDIYAK